MSEHLPILQAMFPGQLMLSIEDIAKTMNVSKGHIYNLSSADTLPFKLFKDKLSNRVQVSIIEFAKYLDKSLTQIEDVSKSNVPDLIKKKMGRPRIAKNQATFQKTLSLCVMEEEINTMVATMIEDVSNVEYSDQAKCIENFNKVKSKALIALKKIPIFVNYTTLALETKTKGHKRPKNI